MVPRLRHSRSSFIFFSCCYGFFFLVACIEQEGTRNAAVLPNFRVRRLTYRAVTALMDGFSLALALPHLTPWNEAFDLISRKERLYV